MKLPPRSNLVVTVTITCGNKDDKFPTQSIKITYQNPPGLTISGGFLVAPGVQSFGIKTITTGTNSSGVDVTQSSIAVTGNPTVQVVPFGFANIYLHGSRRKNLSVQLGIGANPNLSSARLEFFTSPFAFMWKDIYFSPGVHIGQHEVLSGGFKVGDVVTGLEQGSDDMGIPSRIRFQHLLQLAPPFKGSKP